MQSTSFPNTYGSLERAEMPRYSSHQQPLRSSSTGQALKGITHPARRNTTDTNLGYEGYGQTYVASQPFPPQWGSDAMYASGQQAMYQPQGINPTMMNSGIGQPPSTPLNPIGLSVACIPADCDNFGDLNNNPVNHTQYNNYDNSIPFNIDGALQVQQTDPMPLHPQPQNSAYETSQPQIYGVRQQQAYDAAGPSGTTENHPYGNPPAESQPWTIPVGKPHPDRNYQ